MSILIKPRQIQLYAGEAPRETYSLDLTGCFNNIPENYRNLAKLTQDLTKEITRLQGVIKEEQEQKSVIKHNLLEEKKKTIELENEKTQLTTELTNKNNEANTIIGKWKGKFTSLTELSGGIEDYWKVINEKRDAINEQIRLNNLLNQEQNKNKQLEIQITNKGNDISQRNKTIQSLELKHEKLTDSYKKLIQHLADARQLVVHLQKDLQTEKQDKAHIQKELDDALAILNKPTAEMGTQTDLTAEQITQMEKDIKTKKNELAQLKEEQEEEIDKKVQEITVLQTKYDMETKTKEKLLEYLSVYRKQNILQYLDNISKENKVGIEEFLDQHLGFFTKVNYLVFKLTSDRVIDFNWIERIASNFSLCLEISYSRMISAERPAPKIILNNLPKHFKKVDKLSHEWIDWKQTKEIKYEPEVVINYKE